MKGLALSVFLIVLASSSLHARNEYLIVSGGPSLTKWEKYKQHPHDRWWGNFIRTARVRIEEIRRERGPEYPITWYVYRPAYVTRGAQDGRDYVELIRSVRDKFAINLVFFDRTEQLINYINRGRNRLVSKIEGFEFYGHSNKAAFMFDYSNNIDSSSKAWLHEGDLKKINRRAFAKRAFVKSWGCHTGESMSKWWRRIVGVPMIGAIGKTDYSPGYYAVLSDADGRWVK